jgi:hypothetical protein
MILSAKIDDSLSAEFELDFATSTWSLPPAAAKWGGVMFSDRGTFETKQWGVTWLMDAMGSGKKDSTIILYKAPTDEKDQSHDRGTGRVFAPAVAKYKEKEVQWRVVRRATESLGSPSAGDLTKVRIKARTICEGLLPKPGRLTNGTNTTGASGTGCGEFPGRVLRRMPVKGAPARDAFYLDVPGAGVLDLTSPTTHWESFSREIDKKFNPVRKTWVEFTGSNRPKTGDIYLLSKFESKSAFQHVGMIISSEGTEWTTADGGQGNGWQSGFIKRKFLSTGQMDGEFGNKAWLKGWVDLDNLRETLAKYFPPELA